MIKVECQSSGQGLADLPQDILLAYRTAVKVNLGCERVTDSSEEGHDDLTLLRSLEAHIALNEDANMLSTQYLLDCLLVVALIEEHVKEADTDGDILKRHWSSLTGPKGLHSILLHAYQIRANGIAAMRQTVDDAGTRSKEKPVIENTIHWRAGIGLYLHLSMLNHDCNPNCVLTYSDCDEIGLRTVRGIGEGEELCISYGPAKGRMQMPERRHKLWDQYHFECKCSTCQAEMRESCRSVDLTDLEKKYEIAVRYIEEAGETKAGIGLARDVLEELAIRNAPLTLLAGKVYDLLSRVYYAQSMYLESLQALTRSLKVVRHVYGKHAKRDRAARAILCAYYQSSKC